MARKPRRERDQTNIDITPMLDVTFIMLIFFIVTTSFVKETGIEVNRPEAETGVRKQRGNILIGLRANGEIWINKIRTELAAVGHTIERLRTENPEGEVVIVADSASDSEIVINIMDQLARSGILNVAVATRPAE